MFTGLVQAIGRIAKITDQPPGRRFHVSTDIFQEGTRIGDSISLSGCCLTVIEVTAGELVFDAGEETLNRTTFKQLRTGDRVNLEHSLRVGDELGGHMVTGHIDTVGKMTRRVNQGDWSELTCEVPIEFQHQLANKGSIAMDGVSLTLVNVASCKFSVALIPHTLAVTTLGTLQRGDEVNIETDILAKYVERQLTTHPKNSR